MTDPNAGPACTSGTLLHIKLIGTFPTIGVGLLPTAGAPGASNDYSVTTVPPTPDPGATLLFTH